MTEPAHGEINDVVTHPTFQRDQLEEMSLTSRTPPRVPYTEEQDEKRGIMWLWKWDCSHKEKELVTYN